MMKRLKKAFTITELVIVIAVIAILAAVLIPTFSHVVENANQSAALQTCRNSMTEYLTMVTTDENPNNDDATGAVFVYNGYSFVYINSQLHYIGKVDSFANITISGDSYVVNKRPTNGVIGDATYGLTLAESVTGTSITASYTVNSEPKTEQFTLTTLSEKTSEVDGETVVDHRAENLYFYSIEINNSHYNGWFTYEAGANPVLTLNGATYARSIFVASVAVSIA